MSEETKLAFDKLDINTKRNRISDELLIIYELIKKFENAKNINPITISYIRIYKHSETPSILLCYVCMRE